MKNFLFAAIAALTAFHAAPAMALNLDFASCDAKLVSTGETITLNHDLAHRFLSGVVGNIKLGVASGEEDDTVAIVAVDLKTKQRASLFLSPKKTNVISVGIALGDGDLRPEVILSCDGIRE